MDLQFGHYRLKRRERQVLGPQGPVDLSARSFEILALLLALPRPKMLKRVLQSVTSLGVKQLYLLNSYRVEKSYWGSPLLQADKLQEQLLLGLEQACDTILPQVHLFFADP